MPLYLFSCPECERFFDAVFGMNDEKHPICPSCKNTSCDRVFTVPRTGVDTRINPHDIEAMTQKTSRMRGNIGNLWDMAAEASEKRGKHDPIKQAALNDYAKRRKGKQYRKQPKSFDIEFKVKK